MDGLGMEDPFRPTPTKRRRVTFADVDQFNMPEDDSSDAVDDSDEEDHEAGAYFRPLSSSN
jgi:hypothetical protein